MQLLPVLLPAFPNYSMRIRLTSKYKLELIVGACVWRNVKVGEVGDELGVVFAGSLVWGDVDPHGCGLCACESDCSTSVVEVGATALFEGQG